MDREITFGSIVKERRHRLGLTQAELARRANCAAITVRKIEADAMNPSRQMVEQLAKALQIPADEREAFVRLARDESEPTPIPPPQPNLEEIGQADLTGRAIKGFELGERIAVGGFGAVYRALQPTVEREVAIKIILPQYADHPEFIRRFEAEAQLVARLEHPHVVPLYDYWREPAVAYLVMRLMRGGSLQERLNDGPLSLEASHRLMQQIGDALHSAHRAGVVHRDIKPANVLLDEDDNAYLADFGFAKSLGTPSLAEQTQAGTVVGSLAYLSPEQIQAEPVRPQSDIYSLGIMLYEILSGQKPFQGASPVDFIRQHLSDPVPALRRAVADADVSAAEQLVALDPVIAQATAKRPDDRYPDVRALLADLRQALQATTAASGDSRWAISTIGPAPLQATQQTDLDNPFKGLRPFTEADSSDFFGRDTLIQTLLDRLTEPGDLARFLAVVGPSGSGKSSVVKAGLLPVLRQGGLPGADHWFIVEMMPGSHPFEELEAALLRVAVNPPDSLLAQLRDDERGLLRAVRRILPAGEATDLLLVIDQFEEIFTQCEDEGVRARFMDSLVTACLDPRSRLRVIITLRADFTDRPLQYVDFGELIRQRTEFVLPLTPDELEEAIAKPAGRVGLSLEPGLASTIIRDLGDQPGTLPLLQYTLTELFERRVGNALILGAYQSSGGVRGALASRADDLYTSLDDAGQLAARQLFLRLITLGEVTSDGLSAPDTRRRVLRSELGHLSFVNGHLSSENQIANDQGQMTSDKIIDLFGRHRLLAFDRDPVTRGPTVEVAHEALIREWDRLRRWLDEDREFLMWQQRLRAGLRQWQTSEYDEGALLRGAPLAEAENWFNQRQRDLNETEREFIQASLALREQKAAEREARLRRELEVAQDLAKEAEARRQAEEQHAREAHAWAQAQSRAARRLRWLAVGLALFLAAAIGGAWFAFNQREIAQSNFETAERIRLAAQAQIALDRGEDVVLPALLSLRSLQYGYSPEADAALLSALSRGFARQLFIGHTDALASVDFSPDGEYVLTAANDATARLWDAQTGEEIRRFNGHTELVSNAIFTPDGQRILTGSADRTVRLWNAATGQEVGRLPRHNSPVWALAISPDGQTVLTSDESGSAWLWDLESAEVGYELSGHGDLILRAAFSPDGRTVFTGSFDNTARLWDVDTGQELRRFKGHAAAVSGGQFSPDGRFLATASYDNTARLWEVATGQEIRRFIGHTNTVQNAAFSPDGRYLLTGGHDDTARLWDVDTGQELRRFTGHTGLVGAVAFSPDGQLVLTGSTDRTARLWDIWIDSEPRRFARPFRTIHGTDVVWAGFLSGEEQLLTGNGDGTVQVWNIQSGQIIDEKSFETGGFITDMTFSPDNRLALTASGDGLARLWEVQTGQELSQMRGHSGAIWATAFSSDGRVVATGGEDGTARLWDHRRDGTELYRLAGHAGPVRAVAFSPDGQAVLTGSDDGLARLWDARTGQEIRQFSGHAGPVLGVAFSPDGQLILTGSSDQTAWQWEVESGRAVRQLVGHTDQVWVVAFSPDGRYLLTGSDDRTARLWDAATGRIMRQFVGHAASLRSLVFSSDGRYVLTGDFDQAYLWQTNLADLIATTCAQLPRDFTADERALYSITDDAPTCPQQAGSAPARPSTAAAGGG